MPSSAKEMDPPRISVVVGRLERSELVRRQLQFWFVDVDHAEIGQVVEGRAESDRLGDRRRTGFVLVRQGRVGRTGHGDLVDHLAAAKERWQRLEQVAAR